MKYVIKSHEKPGFMIAGIGIGMFNVEGVFLYGWVNLSDAPITWTQSTTDALKLEEGEALAAITFIGDAIDWELSEGLYAEQLEGNAG